MKNSLSKITQDRVRTNLFKRPEQKLIVYLVERVPAWVTSNMLTYFGFFGCFLIGFSFILARYQNKSFLFMGVLGVFINWFGDSLDGRLAYFRDIPRKWYGYTLDIVMDWLGIIVIGFGFLIYLDHAMLIGFVFFTFYAWSIIQVLIKYHVTGRYEMDAGGLFGPTELKILLCIFLILEFFFHGAILMGCFLGVGIFFIINTVFFNRLLKEADEKDSRELRKL